MTYKLRLYVTGFSLRSRRAIANLRAICERDIKGPYEIEIIDVLEHPEKADREKVLATPTLVKRTPEPVCRIVGDLSDYDQALAGLALAPRRRVEDEVSEER